MAHPIGKKNVMRTPEEKEKIVLEYLNGKNGTKTIAGNHDIDNSVLKTWVKNIVKTELKV